MNEVKKATEKHRRVEENARSKAFIPLIEINKFIASETDIDKVLHHIIHTISQTLEADSVSLILIDKESNRLITKTATATDNTNVDEPSDTGENSLSATTARSGKPVVLNGDIDGIDQQTDTSPISAIYVPLSLRGKTIGVIHCTRNKSKGKFTRSELDLLTLISTQTAIIIENANLSNDVQVQQDRIETLIQRFILSQENERNEIAEMLHDTIAQWMVSVSYHSQTCHSLITQEKMNEAQEEASHIVTIIDECVKEIRRMISDLNPADLKELGLVETLYHYIDFFSNEANIKCRLVTEGDQESPLPWFYEISIYRLVLDILNSIRKCDYSGETELYLKFDTDRITLVLWNSGILSGDIDLTAIKERTELLGWNMMANIDGETGNKVVFKIPISYKSCSPFAEGHNLLISGSGGK
jgi:signal transduction histidine kinase